MTRVALIGLGKMGKELLQLLPEYKMSCTLALLKNPQPNLSFPFVSSTEKMDTSLFDLAIDFSSPEGLLKRMFFLAKEKKPVVLGTTGWDKEKDTIISLFKKHGTPLVFGSNFSLAAWFFRSLLKSLAHTLKNHPNFDIGLFEAHHRGKKDSPSGTMISISEDILTEYPERKICHSTEEGPIPKDGLDVATLRVGSVPGYHMAWIDGPEETIQISHSVRNRKTFARGALEAAELLLKHPGVWHFHELLQLKEKN